MEGGQAAMTPRMARFETERKGRTILFSRNPAEADSVNRKEDGKKSRRGNLKRDKG